MDLESLYDRYTTLLGVHDLSLKKLEETKRNSARLEAQTSSLRRYQERSHDLP